MDKLKLFILFILLVFSLSIVGCKSDQIPEEDMTIEEIIRTDYLNIYLLPDDKDAKIDRVMIKHHYGEFNNSHVVMMTDNDMDVRPTLGEETIDGVTIKYNNSYRIKVWNQGKFYTLEEAYEANLLQINDITKINNKQKELYPFIYE